MSGHEARLDAIRRLPKAELHVHLDGSLRPATLHELLETRGIHIPVSDPSLLADFMRVDDARNLEDYLARFEITLAVMQDAPSLERIAFELVLDSAADGVRYVEVRFCPQLNTRGGLTLDEVMHAVQNGLSRGSAASGTVSRVIVCALRNLGAAHGLEMAELAVSHSRHGVVAFDLAGGEAGNPARAFADAFTYARMHDLAVTVHAGEGAGAESIREAVHLCGADRIGHGTRLLEDPALLSYVRDRGIALEVCPTSNVQTRVARSMDEHPLEQQRHAGVIVTLSTDNRLMSGVSLSEEYVRCADAFGYSAETMAALSLSAVDAAFLSLAERRALRAQFERGISEWRSEFDELFAIESAGVLR